MIGDNLRKARQAAGMTQENVLEHIEGDAAKLSNWENGKHLPHLATFIKLCKIYGCTPNDILEF